MTKKEHWLKRLTWAFVLAIVGAAGAFLFNRSVQPPPLAAFQVSAKYGLVTNHNGCGDSSSKQYAGMEPRWKLRLNGELLSEYSSPRGANFKTGKRIPASGSLRWEPRVQGDLLVLDGEVCDLDGDPPRCQLQGTVHQTFKLVGDEFRFADGSQPVLDDDGYLALDAVFESSCGFSLQVEVKRI
jgi:hypothetical protein